MALNAINMSGLFDMLLGLGLLCCALLVVFFGAVGLETLRRLDETSDRSLARWIRDICSRIRDIGLRTIELPSCRHRTRSGVESPTGDTTDTGVYEATSSGDDIPLDTVTQVSFSSFVNVFFFFFCMATQFVY